MWLQIVSMKHPVTVIVAVISIMLVAVFGISSMKEDIFPDLNLPVIYVVQGFGGMAPDQMEGYIVSTYEVHFLYIPGIDHIESQSIQNVSMMKVFFHPGNEHGRGALYVRRHGCPCQVAHATGNYRTVRAAF